jgi:putative heme-binding domain-containing protein
MKTHLPAFAALLAAAAAAIPAAGQAGKKKAPKPPDKPADPVERLAEVKPAAGFAVTMFAHPPDISYPACVACKPDGDVFVGVDTNGSLGKKPGGGKIVLCRDTDGDGKADKFVDFAKVESPRGMIWDRDRLYVLHPPFLSVFPDKGDGTAGPPTVLLKGLGPGIEGPRGADHTTNGIRMGVDGWIYIAVGDFGFPKAETRDGKSMVFHGGGVARVRPDGTELEIVSRGQRNIYDVGLSPTLEIFTRDNTNDGDGWDVRLSHIPANGFVNFGYPTLFKGFSDEIVPPLADYGGGSPTGAAYLAEGSWPAGWNDTFLSVEWGRGAVFAHPVERQGATYKPGVGQKPLVTMPRPTGIDIDASGRMYIGSWKDGGFSFSRPDVGYVVRIVPKDLKPEAMPALKSASDADLIGLLSSGSAVRRFAAQREILHRGDKPGVADALVKLAGSDAPVAVRVAAVFTLKQLLGAKSHEAIAALAGKADLREHVLRALADRRGQAVGAPVRLFVDSLADADPRVRLQAVAGLARLGAMNAAPAMMRLTADPDPIVAHVAINGLIDMGAADAALAALDAGNPDVAAGALRVLQLLHQPPVVEALIARLGAAKDPVVRAALLRTLCRLARREAAWDLKWWGTRPDTRGPYYKPEAWSESAKIETVLRSELKTAEGEPAARLAAEILRHRIDLPEAIERLVSLAAAEPKLRSVAVDVLSRQPSLTDAMAGLLETVAADRSADAGLQAAALRTLGKSTDAAMTRRAVKALAAAYGDGSQVPGPVRSAWDDFARDKRHYRNVKFFAKLAGDGGGAEAELAWRVLLAVAGGKGVEPRFQQEAAAAIDVGWKKPASSVKPLVNAVAGARSLEHAANLRSLVDGKDTPPDVRTAAVGALKALGLDKTADPESLIAAKKYDDVLAAVLKTKGDPAAGAALFTRQNCVNCHTINKADPVKGPYLGDIANRYPRAELVEAVLKPNAKIAQGFETQVFQKTDGVIETGFVTRESGDEVELRNANGAVLVIKKEDIEARKKAEQSVMPEGLVNNITPAELASLIAYLEQLAKDAKPDKP